MRLEPDKHAAPSHELEYLGRRVATCPYVSVRRTDIRQHVVKSLFQAALMEARVSATDMSSAVGAVAEASSGVYDSYGVSAAATWALDKGFRACSWLKRPDPLIEPSSSTLTRPVWQSLQSLASETRTQHPTTIPATRVT